MVLLQFCGIFAGTHHLAKTESFAGDMFKICHKFLMLPDKDTTGRFVLTNMRK
jgi:hypothetical protein